MRRWIVTLLAAAMIVTTAPVALADDPGDDPQDPPAEAHYGLCTAEEASQPGDDNSNGTVASAPPFANTTEEECDQAERPGNGTAPGYGPDDHPDDEDHPNGSDDGDRSDGSQGSEQADGSEGQDRSQERDDEADDRR